MNEGCMTSHLYLPGHLTLESHAIVTKWFFSKGEVFRKGDLVAEAETENEQTLLLLEAQQEAMLDRQLACEGQRVEIAQPIAEIAPFRPKNIDFLN